MDRFTVGAVTVIESKTMNMLEQYIESSLCIVDYYVMIYAIDSYHYSSNYFDTDLKKITDCLIKNVGIMIDSDDTMYRGIGWEVHIRKWNSNRDQTMNELLNIAQDKSAYLLNIDIRDQIVVIPEMWKYNNNSMRSDAYNIKTYILDRDLISEEYIWCPYIFKNNGNWRYIAGTLTSTVLNNETDYILETSVYVVRNRWTVDAINIGSIEGNYYRIGLLHRLMGRYEDAISAYKERVMQYDMIYDYSEEICNSYYSMAICSLLLGNDISCQYYLKMAAYLYGHMKVECWCSLIMYYISENKIEDALCVAEDSVNLVTDSKVLYLLSIYINICYRLNRYEYCLELCSYIEDIVQYHNDSNITESALNTVYNMRRLCG